MRNKKLWKPSKFVFKDNRFLASSNTNYVSISSRLNTNLIAKAYERYIPVYAYGIILDARCGAIPLYELYRPHVSRVYCFEITHF